MVFRPGKKISWQEPVWTSASSLHKGSLIKTSYHDRYNYVVMAVGHKITGTFRKKSEFFLTLRKVDRWGHVLRPSFDAFEGLTLVSASQVLVIGELEF